MLKIYLARHGQNEDNLQGILNGHRDAPLTELGYHQAKQLAVYIKDSGLNFDKIYSSPLIRAYETAKEVSSALSLSDPEILPQLIERDFGVMTGQKFGDITKLCAPDIIKAENGVIYFLNPEGAETFPDLILRAKGLLEFIKDKHKDGNILLVSHGDTGKMIYASYYDLNWLEVLTSFHFGNSELILLSPDILPEKAQVFKTVQHNL